MPAALQEAFISSRFPPAVSVPACSCKQVHHNVALRAWKRTKTSSSPRIFWDAGTIREEEDLGPGMIPCEVLPGKHRG